MTSFSRSVVNDHCSTASGDRGVVHRMPTPLASRFVHLDIRVDAEDWLVWGAGNGIAPEVLFFVQLEPTLLHQFDPQSKEKAFPSSAGPIVVLHLPCEIGTRDPA